MSGGSAVLGDIESSGHWISLTSRNIDDPHLEALARAAVRTDDGNVLIPPTALVDGLTLVLGADTPLTDKELFGGPNVAGEDYAAPDSRSVSLRVALPRPAGGHSSVWKPLSPERRSAV